MVKHYEINLDLPGKDRWCAILADNKSLFPRIVSFVNNTLKGVGYSEEISKIVGGMIWIYQKNIAHLEELSCIANTIGISLDKLIIMQLIYEASAACTSVVSKIDNEYVMFRTMDWSMDIQFLKDITIDIDFYSKDRKVFRATTWLGYVGVLTGLSYVMKYSIAINYRRTTNNKESYIQSLFGNIVSTLLQYWPISYLIRNVLQNNRPLEETKSILREYQLISPCYITICCKENSCIIVRDPKFCVKEISIEKGSLIQTNVDDDKTQPDILYSNARRVLCEKIISSENMKGKSISKVMEQFKIFPIFNSDTIYWNVMIPEVDYYNTSNDSRIM